MSYLNFSDDEVMTRKEYLKSKRKIKLPSIKTILLIIIIILLSMYVTKQIKTYNTVTLAAKKVVEESSLIKTLKIYYMNSGYTKDSENILTKYSNQDESRTEYIGTESMTNLKVLDNYVYGIKNNSLCRIKISNTQTQDENSLEELVKDNVIGYNIYNNYIYVVKYQQNNNDTNGVYKFDIEKNNVSKIISGTIYQLAVNENNIYVVMPAKTDRSIVSFDKSGKGKTVLTSNEIVSYITVSLNNIVFTNQLEKGRIYLLNIKNKNITKLSEELYGNYIKTGTKTKINGNNYINMYENNIIYLSSTDSKIYSYNINTKESVKLFNETTNDFQIVDKYIYYKESNSLKIMEYNIKDKILTNITSIRSNEFICTR